jgi:hypothetical protein
MEGMDALLNHSPHSRWLGIEFVAKSVAVAFCIISSSIPAIAKEIGKPTIIQGKVDRIFYQNFKSAASSSDHIVFSSVGGDARTAMKIANYLQIETRLKISVGGLCLSACAEILFPAALKFSNFSFVHKPLIGFHHNSEIVRRSLRSQDASTFEKCGGLLNSDFIRFLDDVGRRSESINTQMTAIAVVEKSAVVAQDCSTSRVTYARKYWFPTSKQLSILFTADDMAPVCADDLGCIGTSLLVLGQIGDRFLVGSTEYTVIKNAAGKKAVQRGETLELGLL